MIKNSSVPLCVEGGRVEDDERIDSGANNEARQSSPKYKCRCSTLSGHWVSLLIRLGVTKEKSTSKCLETEEKQNDIYF